MEEFREIIQKGKPFLRQYLEDNGIEIVKGKFICINPEHDDHDPSCSLYSRANEEIFVCFGCGISGDIYTAAAMLEDKPLTGIGFLKENVEYILKRYGVEYQEIELTEEQKLQLRVDRVYKAAVDILTQLDEKGELIYANIDYAKTRGWSLTTCKTLGIGTINDYDQFMKILSYRTGLSQQQLQGIGITRELFGPDLLTFVVRDKSGHPLGFIARYINYKKKCGKPKYMTTSSLANPLFIKDNILYGLYNAVKYVGLRLDIFEGVGSYVTAYQAGYRNCIALLGVNLSDNHVRLLYDLGFRYLNLVLDADAIGIKKSEEYIEKLAGFKGLKVTITRLPIPEKEIIAGGNDPDYFINKYGIAAYRTLRPIGAFEFKMQKIKDSLVPGSEEAKQFAKDMVALLVNEEDLIERGAKIKILAECVGIDKEDIRSEIERLTALSVDELTREVKKKLLHVRSIDELEDVIQVTSQKISETTATSKDKYLVSVAESIETWNEIFESIENSKTGIHGWTTGYPELDNIIDGITIPTQGGGSAYGLAGAPQSGKSAAMLNIAYNVASKNDDVCVLYWAIDDNRRAIAYRLISMISGVSIRKVRNIITPTVSEKRKIKEAEEKLIELTANKKLIFKDDRFGRQKVKAQNWINEMQDLTGQPILLCVDSMHNVSAESADIRTKLVNVSTWLKGLCTSVPLSVIATIELIKNRGDSKPNLQFIAESGKIEFDFDAIAIVWNESQGLYGNVKYASAKWVDKGNVYKPIIELDFQKNKTAAGEKGSVYCKFDPETTAILEISKEIEDIKLEPQADDVVTPINGNNLLVISTE